MQNLLSPSLLSKNIYTKIYGTIILPVVFAWVWNFVSNIDGGMYAEGVWEKGAEEDTWAWQGSGNRVVEKNTYWGAL